MNDKAVINEFVRYLAENGYPRLQIGRYPDEENRDSSDVDAIAGQFAIEHTSLDTVVNQRRDSSWFMQAVGSLGDELQWQITFRLSLVIPYEGVKQGQDWTAIKSSIQSWIINKSPLLTDGLHPVQGVPGVPFGFHVIKRSNRPPGLFIGRSEPPDDTLATRIRELFDRKASKLARYKAGGFRTTLLVESDDIALINEFKLVEAIHEGYQNGLPAGVDEIWFADTSIPEFLEFSRLSLQLHAGNQGEQHG